MPKKVISVLICFVSFFAATQEDEALYSRLQALKNSDITYYNVDGIIITSQATALPFNDKNLKKVFKQYDITQEDLKALNPNHPLKDFCITKNEDILSGLTLYTSYYFIEDTAKNIVVVWFGSVGKHDAAFEKHFIKLIVNNKIPKSCYASPDANIINFGGREILLEDSCYWTNINTVQCPYMGEMNWSVHKDAEDAKKSVENQLAMTKSKKEGKIISEETVDILFENIPTKATKIVYDFTGIKSVLASTSGGKTLTVYYVSQKVRNNYMSCVLSYWNNDDIEFNGLPFLLDQIMQLK